MKKTAIFLITLLTFSLFSPYNSLAESEDTTNDVLNQQYEQQSEEVDEEQKNIPIEESDDDLLGHIRDAADVKIYKDLNDLSIFEIAGSAYEDKVYYIKKQATIDDQLYYLITNDISDGKADVGWLESESLEIQPFVIVDEKEKTLFINGTGEAYNNAWGGKADIVYNLAEFENLEFKINFTQKVGDNTWYRGILDEETIWIQSSNLKEEEKGKDSLEDRQDDGSSVEEPEKSDEAKENEQPNQEDLDNEIPKEARDEVQLEEVEANTNAEKSEKKLLKQSATTVVKESKTSKLGHIRRANVDIHQNINDLSSSKKAGDKFTNTVYYIKKQATVNRQLYYLVSTKPSSSKGVVGWVKSQDLSVHSHVGLDKKTKTFTVKGSGNAYDKAWGGNKNLVYNLSKYKNQVFNVHLTEKVGNNTWYRGTLNGKTVWIHSSYVSSTKESKTSRLGHIRSGAKIYKKIGDESSSMKSTKYLNAVYYIKKRATVNGQLYYLISTEPSSTKDIVGWVKSQELSTHPHVGVDKKVKTFYVKGSGKAYDTAWGGDKNLVYNLSQYKNQVFKVNLTEEVGNNTWYRGVLNGKTVWIHSSYVGSMKESNTSRLGHVRNSKVKIYKDIGNESTVLIAGSKYTHSVYYIKKQANLGNQLYYLISTEPSSLKGVVGWVKSQDLSTHSHVSVDKKDKTFNVKGSGKAYDTAWGGDKNLVYNLSQYKEQAFKVHLTEKVGNNIWYRGKLNGKTVWIHESYLSQTPLKEVINTYTNYDLTLNKMADIQMVVNPQTDKKYQLWIREDAFKKGSIKNGKATVSGDNWNLRRGPGTNNLPGGKVNNGTILTLKSNAKGSDGYTWYHVRDTSGWVTPDMNDLKYYLNPLKFTGNLKDSLQFLKLSESANLNIAEINEKILKGKGILAGKAQSFADGAKTYGVNEIYLISHALLETGNGTSKLATGVKYKGKTVYNMYGVGAKDSCAEECGTKYAYDAGWFTPELAIKGGAEFVGENYLGAGQDTLYKMRWNPLFAAANGYATHQYATDIGWASKQTTRMYELYSLLNGYNMVLDIPKYK